MRLISYPLIFLTTAVVGSSLDPSPVPSTNSTWKPGEYYRICPLPECLRCPSESELRAPGVGIALETSHGTAAVRLHDGTTHHVALVEGDAAYVELLRRRTHSRQLGDCHDNWERMECVAAQARRIWNKFLGLPSTPEVAILASMVSKLQRASEDKLGQRIPAIVITSPDLVNLENEVIRDVMAYLKLRNLMIQPYPEAWRPFDAASAALVGYGQGLCRDYLDAYECEMEEWYMQDENTLFLDFNAASLSGSIRAGRNVQDLFLSHGNFIDATLGYGNRPLTSKITDHDCSDAAGFWQVVSARIRKLVVTGQRGSLPRISQLVLTGTFASNYCFHTAIRSALQDVVDDSTLAVLDGESSSRTSEREWKTLFEFATARGAAEMAKRRQEGPTFCRQTDACRKRREATHAIPFRQQ